MSHIYKCQVAAMVNQTRADELVGLLNKILGGITININLEKQLLRIISDNLIDLKEINQKLAPFAFQLEQIDFPSKETVARVAIEGMTCHSCELIVERAWKKLPGVNSVQVNASKGEARIDCNSSSSPSIEELQQALGEDSGYLVRGYTEKLNKIYSSKQKPSFWRLAGLFALVIVFAQLTTRLGLLNNSFAVKENMSVGAIFLVGLVAASSSCIAVAGGLLLSATAKFNERYGSSKPLAKMRPVFLFVTGRVIGYMFFGGLLGLVGSALQPSVLTTAIITIMAALFMIVTGLDTLGIAPAWLKNILPRMPKALAHRVMDAEGKEHPAMPFLLGAGTFFLPCGFTQAFQLFALTTGSFAAGASTLGAFALGTAPALLALGWASSSLRGAFGKFFFQLSGALVIVLGLWNIQNGLTIAGYPITWLGARTSGIPAVNSLEETNSNITLKDGVQIAKMTVKGAYRPDHFVVKAGRPVRWEVDGTDAEGCISVLTSRKLGVQKILATGINVIEFTPEEPGEIPFSCSMGMYRGSFTVISSKT